MTEEEKSNKVQNEIERKEFFKEELKKKAMDKLAEAINLNKKNSLSKESREAKAEACALILIAMRAEVQFNPKDPLFQIFVQKQSWRNAMKRACKEVCDKGTDLCRKTMNVLKSIGIGIINVGDLAESIINIFSKHGVNPLESAEVINEDNWSDFYDDIPKDGGNSVSSPNNSQKMEMSQSHKKTSTNIRTFLSKRSIGSNQSQQKITNQDFHDFLFEQMGGSYKKTQINNHSKSSSKKAMDTQQLMVLSQKRNTPDAA